MPRKSFICIDFNCTGNRVELSFRMFDVQATDFCNGDFLEVRSGHGGGRLLGHFCGSDTPTNITVANKLWIKFRSDDVGTAAGFIADYSLSELLFLIIFFFSISTKEFFFFLKKRENSFP